MPKYMIERDIPNIGQKSFEEFQDIARKSLDAIESLGSKIYWLESFVTDNKIYAVYHAPNEQLVHDHAKKVGVPVSRISEIRMIADPTLAEVGKRTQFRPSGSR